jgi:surface polysaccharide O-acyltransferase-like enzyme
MAAQRELTTSQLPGAGIPAPSKQLAQEGKRLLFVDNLRILLICGVLVQHLSVTYGSLGSWYYRDPNTNLLTGVLLSIPSGIGMACGMGFFFLLAGYFTPGSYDRKGPKAFLQERLVRLGLPLLLYNLLIEPLVVYIAGGLHGSYWSFYSTFLLQTRGVNGVVWFLAVLLVFSLLYAGWRGLTRYRIAAFDKRRNLPSYPAIAVFILALGLVTFVIRIWWPMGWVFQPISGLSVGYLPQYLSFYILGAVAYRREWFFKLTPRMARDWSLIALLATLLVFGALTVPMLQAAGTAGTHETSYPMAGGFNLFAFGYALWESFVAVGVCIGLLVLFRQRWNHQGRMARSLTPNVYTVYLIHAPVLVDFAYAFHVVTLYPLLKWAIAVLITIPLCFLISSLIHKLPLVNRIL